MKYQVQGTDGPVEAKRPTEAELQRLAAMDGPFERGTYAKVLADGGCTIDAPVDVNGWDYWKTMEARRQYGYTWVPAGHMANILIAPGLWMPSEDNPDGLRYDAEHPPPGAILVPKSVQDDPNYEPPTVVTPPAPPPAGVADFSVPIEAGDFAGCYAAGPNNTVPPGTHATHNGRQYIYVERPGGFTGKLKLWIPVS